MNLVSMLDLAAAVASTAALLFLLMGVKRRSSWAPEVIIFTLILLLTISHDVGNVFEWTGFSQVFDPVEDYLEVLTAALWAFFFYTFLQELTEHTLREVQELDEKILDGSPVAFILRDADLRILRVSKAFERVTGYRSTQVLGKKTEEFMPDMPGKDELEARLRKALEMGQPVGPTEVEAPSPVLRYIRENIYPVRDPGGRVTNTLSVLEDITEQRFAQNALRESEARYRMLFDNIHDGVFLHELEDDGSPGPFLEMNTRFCAMTGYGRDELLSMTPLDLVEGYLLPEFHPSQANPLQDPTRFFEGRVSRRTGQTLPCELNSHSLSIGGKQAVLSVVRDITERKEAEERIQSSLAEKETLLREIHHRVKNNLQVISGLLNLQSHYIDDEMVRTIYRESQNRIKTMALIHEELYQREDLARINIADYIKGLAGNLMASYSIARGRISLEMDLEDLDIALDTAIPCGLIVNEIVSNSLSHAFPGDRSGQIRIRFKGVRPGKYELTIEDDGIGLPSDLDIRETGSLGLRLVLVLSEQLGADLRVEREKGTSFRLGFDEYLEAGTDMY